MSEITLTNPTINNGVAVTLNGANNVQYSWKNLVRADPAPQKFDTVEADVSGFENPIITIEGGFDVDDLDSSELNMTFLLSFAKIAAVAAAASTGEGGVAPPAAPGTSPVPLAGGTCGGGVSAPETAATDAATLSAKFARLVSDITILPITSG